LPAPIDSAAPMQLSLLTLTWGKVMKQLITSIVFAASVVFVVAPSTGWAKTAGVCNAEYKDKKADLKAQKITKKDFIKSCRAEPDAAPAPTQETVTEPAPVAPKPAPTPQKPVVVAPTTTRTSATPTGAGQFTTDTAAKAKCPSDTVVWVNTKSGVYHFAGTHNYGTTKSGVYMCEADTAAAGYRAAKNEKHP
jgi:hypothetical protein